MKIFAAAMALAIVPSMVSAQATTAPAPAPSSAPATGASANAAINADTPIEAVMASASGKAAIEKVFPEIPGHPAYDQFKGMSIRQLQPLAGGIITDEKIVAFEAAAKA